MFYVYALLSLKTYKLYVGTTDNLKRRIGEHNSGHGGMYSRKNRPYKLIFYEAFLSKTDALKQEIFYKTGYGREVLKDKVENSINIKT